MKPGFLKYLERSFKGYVVKPAKRRLKYGLAKTYRWVLDKAGSVCFIGITGS